ncbi:MAG: glycosyltransferase family 2 protein [Bacteriovoracaceae bacterium]|nr:glycosyltransferase family 2 protein [Bacteriovoracaceae bacterium]
MLIDVILPTFNRASILDRAIQSVLGQKHKHFNLYVIDDGSTDDTAHKMAQYSSASNVHYLRQDNKGVSAARNLGIKTSSAPWIAFLDSDDEWLPQKLQTQVNFLSENPALRFVHSNEMWIRNGVRVNPKQKFDKSNFDIFRRSLEMCLISPSTVMMKRELCEEHGHFDEEFIVCEDYDLWLKILATEEVGFISDHLVKKYGGHEDQLSTKYPAMDYWRIRSLVRLLTKQNLSEDKKEMILIEINKKAPILLQGYLKHQNLNEHAELSEMVRGLLRR